MKLIFHLPDGKVEKFSTDKSTVTVGRGKDCEIHLPYEGFSRRHAQVDLIDGEIFVTDLGSTNGVHIDGERIAANEKTQIQSFFNLQIGPAQQVEIFSEDDAPVIANYSKVESTNPSRSSAVPRSEKTKTTRMDTGLLRKSEATRTGSSQKDKSGGGSEQKSKMTMVLMVVLILAAAAYYFMGQQEDLPVPGQPVVEQQSSAPVVPISESNFVSSGLLESLFKDKTCDGEKDNWCKDVGVLSSKQEGVVFEGKSLLIYMNMTLFMSEKFETGFASSSDSVKMEVLTLRRIFSSVLLRSFIKQTNFDTVQIVGGVIENGEYRPRIALKIRRDVDLKGFDKFFMIALFDEIINQGKTEELTKISRLYEKLPLN